MQAILVPNHILAFLAGYQDVGRTVSIHVHQADLWSRPQSPRPIGFAPAGAANTVSRIHGFPSSGTGRASVPFCGSGAATGSRSTRAELPSTIRYLTRLISPNSLTGACSRAWSAAVPRNTSARKRSSPDAVKLTKALTQASRYNFFTESDYQ